MSIENEQMSVIVPAEGDAVAGDILPALRIRGVGPDGWKIEWLRPNDCFSIGTEFVKLHDLLEERAKTVAERAAAAEEEKLLAYWVGEAARQKGLAEAADIRLAQALDALRAAEARGRDCAYKWMDDSLRTTYGRMKHDERIAAAQAHMRRNDCMMPHERAALAVRPVSPV